MTRYPVSLAEVHKKTSMEEGVWTQLTQDVRVWCPLTPVSAVQWNARCYSSLENQTSLSSLSLPISLSLHTYMYTSIDSHL